MTSRSPHLQLAHAYWKEHLHPGDVAIDATCGNGYDTAVLAKILLPHSNSLIIGLDVQQEAIDQTSERLKKSFPEPDLSRVMLYRRCHADIAPLPLPVPPHLIVYNLGYLPGGNKTITTKRETTLQSLKSAVDLLAKDGALSITCYPGHEEGAREEAAILEWAKELPMNYWQVSHHRWINREAAPSLLWLVKTTQGSVGKGSSNNKCYSLSAEKSFRF